MAESYVTGIEGRPAGIAADAGSALRRTLQPSPAADAVVCASIVRVHARTFTLASRFLPAEKRRAAFALYAFCRVADDLVDGAAPSDRQAAEAELSRHARRLDDALRGQPDGPVFRELAWVVDRFTLPVSPLSELLDGVRRDLSPSRYRSWSDLRGYCEGVASSVGEMCTHVFGVTREPDAHLRAVGYARTLGVAMQLTNILRDVGEDLSRGRCYLPDEDLAAVGLDAGELLAAVAEGRGSELAGTTRWRMLLEFQVERARALYADAWPGIFLLARDARGCAAACSRGYAAILDAIELNDYDTLSRRARVGSAARLAILWEAWRVRSTP